MEDIKDIVKSVIQNIAEHNPDVYNKTERIWQNVVSEKEGKHTKVLGVKEGDMVVCVETPAWLYQMKIRQRSILKKLKEELPEIKNIRFKMGKIK